MCRWAVRSWQTALALESPAKASVERWPHRMRLVGPLLLYFGEYYPAWIKKLPRTKTEAP